MQKIGVIPQRCPRNLQTNRADGLKLWSCVNCRRRKVRCDRRHPCAPCTKNNTECVFPVSGRVPRRSRDANYPNPPGQKQVELLGRLRRLEALVGDLGSQVEHAAAASQESSSSVTNARAVPRNDTACPDHQLALHGQSASENSRSTHNGVQTGSRMAEGTSELPQRSDETGDIVMSSNGDLVVGDRFWTVFCKEVEHIFEAVRGPTSMHYEVDNSSSMPTSNNQRHTGYYSFLLQSALESQHRKDLHPLPSQMLFLLQIYMDNVDPFMKVLHLPTLTKTIREIRGSYDSLDPSIQALVLAISMAAIMSLEDEEVHVNFNTDKDQLVARYRLGTEQALEQADFLNHPNITVLQALTIYVGVLQNTGETRPAWYLAGVLVRVAVSMKLHRDGSHFANITPFENEIRRRLWWQICFIDSQSEDAQVSEYKISECMFDPQLPANTDDKSLDPGMLKSPAIMEGWTDMTVFLIRCEVWKLSRRLQSLTTAKCVSPPSLDERLVLFQQCQATIENTYLKRINPTQPLPCFVATIARLFLTKVDLVLHTKRHSASVLEPQLANNSHSDKIFMSSLSIIEYTFALQNESGWSGWTWQIQGRQPPWHALLVVLGQLSTRRWDPICERAWFSAKRSLDSLPEMAQGDPRHQQLSVLTSTVKSRVNELHHQNSAELVNAHDGVTSATALDLSAPFAQVGISGTGSTWTLQEPFLVSVDSNSNDVLNLEMDWQFWDDIAGEVEPSLEFWDMGGL